MIDKLFETAAKVGTPWSLAAFAIAAVVAIVSMAVKTRGKNSIVAWGAFAVIVVLGIIPIMAPAYLTVHSVFRVRVNVLDDHGSPVDEANVTSSIGGEAKKVSGGWEFDIPPGSKPADGKLTVYASLPSAFLKGHAELALDKDFAPVITVRMARDDSGHISGIVVDGRRHNRPVQDAVVAVFGFDSEAVRTGPSGTFTLHAHAAVGQQVQIYAQKQDIGSATQLCEAGDVPVTIALNNP